MASFLSLNTQTATASRVEIVAPDVDALFKKCTVACRCVSATDGELLIQISALHDYGNDTDASDYARVPVGAVEYFHWNGPGMPGIAVKDMSSGDAVYDLYLVALER